MQNREREHFDNIAHRYDGASDSWSTLYAQIAPHVNHLIEGRRVLDVGSGGNFGFDPSLPSELLVLDISAQMLEGIGLDHAVKIVGDAREMAGVDDASVDVVVFVFSLHHINGRSVDEAEEALGQVMKAAARVLRPDGLVVIADNVPHGFLYWLQTLLFPVIRRVFALFGVSMVFFFPAHMLSRAFAEHLGTASYTEEPLSVEGAVDPLGGSFPGLIAIPSWLEFARRRVIVARRDSVGSATGAPS
jgi:ubiquinone/menaquinone biosynthesis C-methylase UbiE